MGCQEGVEGYSRNVNFFLGDRGKPVFAYPVACLKPCLGENMKPKSWVYGVHARIRSIKLRYPFSLNDDFRIHGLDDGVPRGEDEKILLWPLAMNELV